MGVPTAEQAALDAQRRLTLATAQNPQRNHFCILFIPPFHQEKRAIQKRGFFSVKCPDVKSALCKVELGRASRGGSST